MFQHISGLPNKTYSQNSVLKGTLNLHRYKMFIGEMHSKNSQSQSLQQHGDNVLVLHSLSPVFCLKTT